MSTNSVTVNIHLRDGAPGPQVINLADSGDPLVAVEFTAHPATVNILVSSVEQADSLIRAAAAAKELLTGGGAS
jgi:hypothetical protein